MDGELWVIIGVLSLFGALILLGFAVLTNSIGYLILAIVAGLLTWLFMWLAFSN